MLINIPSLDNYINSHWDEIKEDVIDRMADKLAKSMMVQRPLKKWIFENLSEDEIADCEEEFKNEIIKILEEKRKNMDDYIKREDAIKAIKKDIMGGLNYESILNRLPSADVNEIFEKAIICGYTLKDLTVFADACRKNGITEKDLADFNRNAASAYKYVLEEIEKEFNDVVIDKWHVKEEK